MKLIVFLILTTLCCDAAEQTGNPFRKTVFSKNISFIRTDSTHGSQSTVIEYPEYLVLIELPMIDAGAGRSTNLEEDIPKAEAFLAYLEMEYHKPVKYVLSSHWHLHSLSGITPLFKKGAKLVTAKSNWAYSLENGLLKNQDTRAYSKQVVTITRDTTLLGNTRNPIQVLFLDQTYVFKPTKDYLFFYLPNGNIMHASCMCAMPHIDFKERPEFMYNDRVSDLEKAITSRNLPVEHLIKLSGEYDKEKKAYKPVTFTHAYYIEFKQRGTPVHVVVKNYSRLSPEKLSSRRDSILHHLVEKKIFAGLINSVVYDCIRENQFQSAVAWAQLLNLYEAGNTNYIDTLGEAHFRSGDVALAQYYSNLLARLDSKGFPNAFQGWEKNKLNEGQ